MSIVLLIYKCFSEKKSKSKGIVLFNENNKESKERESE